MRQRIIESAGAAFAERGFFGASMREIGLRIGIAEGRVYRYFPHKAALLDAIAADAIARLKELRDEIETLAGDEPDIRRFMQAYAVLSERHYERCHAWYAIWLQTPPLSEGRVAELNLRSSEMCHVLAETIAARTDVPDAQMVANIFSGVLFTQGIFRNRIGIGGVSEELAARLVDSTLPPPRMLT